MKLPVAYVSALCALFCAMAMPLPLSAEDKPLTREEVEAIVKQVIKDNPELIMKTVMDYQEKEAAEHLSKAAQNLTRMQDKIAHDPRSPSTGNLRGDVTVAEFFDYHCGYCKRFYPELARLIKEDKNVHVVFKEFPILSPDSELAAKAALAVWNIDKKKYFGFHVRLMQSNGNFTEETLTFAATQLGIDADTFKKALADPELQKDLDRNKVLAGDLAITGTPALIIGTQFLPGAVSYDKLKAAVEETRDTQSQPKGKKQDD